MIALPIPMASPQNNTSKHTHTCRRIAGGILSWYARNSRDLPWRKTKNPYHIWVSEIMLQQTQVDTVIPYYHRFLLRFPTVEALALAPLDDVLKAWENLGYYTRARHLHEAAKAIVKSFHGEVPNSRDDLIRLPGIGEYTAGAVMSIAFDLPATAIDANIRRVICRLFAIRDPLHKSQTQKKIALLARELVPEKSPGDFNQGLMDLGASICTSQKPRCTDCPVQKMCRAFSVGIQDTVPVIKKRPPIPHYQTTAAVVTDKKGRLLIVQRKSRGLLGGLWKLPGGRKEPRETLEACLSRTVHEELGLRVQAHEEMAKIKHVYTHFRITLHAFTCRRKSGTPQVLACQDWRWSDMEKLEDFAFSKADRKILKAMRRKK